MWLYFYYNIFLGVIISGEVITLVKENKITCVLTEDSYNSTLDVRLDDGFKDVNRNGNELSSLEENDFWIATNSTVDFGPVLDQRWTDFVGAERLPLYDRTTISFCSTTEWNITVAGYFGTLNVTIPRQYRPECTWQHFTLTKSSHRITLTSIKNEDIFNKRLIFEPLQISIPGHINFKLHRYTHLFSNISSSTKISYIMLYSTKCIALYVSVDIGCYLNISLESNHTRNVITVDGFNKKNSLREWKKYEIGNEIDERGKLSFFRGRHDNHTTGFWAIDDIRNCNSEIVTYEATLTNNTWRNQTCRILNSPGYSNKFCKHSSFGKQCHIKCPTILRSYPNCEKHRICLSENRCHCAWGYKGGNCSESCANGSWGLDCKEKCNIHCEKCHHIRGCTTCKKKYFGEACALGLPVVRTPPTLESMGDSFINISINFEYGENETRPEFYVVQIKKLSTKEIFENVTTAEDYPRNMKNISLLINLTREYIYHIRVILISHNLSVQDNTIPELIIYKASLQADTKPNGTIVLTWSKPGRHTVDSYYMHYECNKTFCSNETKKGNNTNKETSFEYNNINHFKMCTFRLFARIDKRTEFIDQITVFPQNSTKMVQDAELPKNVTLLKNHILIELDECSKFSRPLNYSLELKCISRWCTDEDIKIISYDLSNYSSNLSILVESLYPFTDYNLAITAKRPDQEDKYRNYGNKSTPSSEPHGVKDLSVYVNDIDNNLYIVWKEPYPPTGQIESYSVITRHNTTTTYTNLTFPCKIWSGFVCASLPRIETLTMLNVTVQSKNYGVSEWSAATNLFVALENVTDAPQNFKIKINPKTLNEMIISWKYPGYTFEKIETFQIVINEKHFIEKIKSGQRNYNKSIKIESGKTYNITIWAQNTHTASKKASIYVIISKPVTGFSIAPFVLWCESKCQLELPKINPQEANSFSVRVRKDKKINKQQEKTLNYSLEDKVLCTESNASCEIHQHMHDVLTQDYYLQVYNKTFAIDFSGDVNMIRESVVSAVTILFIILLIIVLLGLTSFYVFRRQKRIFKEHDLLENICILEFNENKKNDSFCTEININDFKDYLLTSLDDNPDDNKIIQQFKAISKTDFINGVYIRTNENDDRNSSENILSHNETAVILNDDNKRRCINANYINGYKLPKAFIATEPPHGSFTVHDFWALVCQENVKHIVMLTQLKENGCIKSEKYWPNDHSHFRFGKFFIESVSVTINSDYVHRILQVKYGNQTRVIHHFLYVTWSNQNVPMSVKNFTSFVKEVMKAPYEGPVVIHCDGGWGRTGLYILCDTILRMSIKEKKVDFFKTLETIRSQRAGLVSHLAQYIFCHFVVLEYYFGTDLSTSETTDDFELKIQEAMQKSSLERLSNSLAKVTEQFHSNSKNSFSAILSDNNINAVTVDCHNYPQRFIVTKQPGSNTVQYFWNLVISYKVEIIVSLNQIDDDSRDCRRFWPNDAQQNWYFGEDWKLTFVSEESSTDVYNTVIVKIDKTKENEARIVKIINVKTWERTSIKPSDVKDLIHVWDKIMLYNGRIVVTCYDGTTASGLFVALAYLLEKINTDRCCDVFKAASSVKRSCPDFIKHPEQIKFLCEAALSYIREFGIYEVVA